RWAGLRVGLLGGSFNPPHEGHVHNSEIAMKYLGLDAVWWLVTPGNPLKSHKELPNAEVRAGWCRDLIQDPRMVVSNLETAFGTNLTSETVRHLRKHFPDTEFVWLAGTEIAHEFHKWRRWKDLIHTIPFAFVGRPTHHGVVRNTVFRRVGSMIHCALHQGGRPPLEKGRIYWIFSESRNPMSSTLIRSQKDGK
ncbi:MAG TPA: nicotinate-nucleotide adenylyltransferase, partial [Alphaproteobacteria bacterium]|nr:nicotinate-nucleotide adenylyltransferase [Alphaproteobacteria bacterium]